MQTMSEEPTEEEINKYLSRSAELVNQIAPMLRGQGPDVQGCVLAELVSAYFAGHHPILRKKCIDLWLECVAGLMEEIDKREGTKRWAK